MQSYEQFLSGILKEMRGPSPKAEKRDDGHGEERRDAAHAKQARRATRRLVEHRRGGWQ